MLRSLVRSSVRYPASRGTLLPFVRSNMDQFSSDGENENEYSDVDSNPVDQEAGKFILGRKIYGAKANSEKIENILSIESTEGYKPFNDPKYSLHRMTEKAATYLDIIRYAPKPDVFIQTNINVSTVREFNLTLLELFTVGKLKEARDYFFKVSSRSATPPIQTSSYNIAIAEFIDAGDVPMATTFFNLLKQTEEGPNITTYNALISASAKYSSMTGVNQYLSEMKECGFEPNQKTREYLIAFHLKRGEIKDAENLVNELGENNVPLYIYALFARAHAEKGNYDEMNECAFGANRTLPSPVCSNIMDIMLSRCEGKQLDIFLQSMEKQEIGLSWTAGHTAMAAFQDARNGHLLTPAIEAMIVRITEAPTPEERIRMIKKAAVIDKEEEIVFRRRRKVPVWKRKVEYKNPADVAWDTLIQEYLAIALKEQKLQTATAAISRKEQDINRAPIDLYKKREKKKIKTRARWNM